MTIPLPVISPLDAVTIATPCQVPWGEMRGDHRSRHCCQCQRKVFDLSALTTAEAMELLGNSANLPCVRLYRRIDGRVMTADCPVGLRARIWRRLRRRAAWVASLFAMLFLQSCKTYTQGLAVPEPIKRAEYPLVFRDGPKKDKRVVVALFISDEHQIDLKLSGSEEILACELAKKMPDLAKDAKPAQILVVLNPDEVNKFKKNNPNWKSMHPSEWGKKLGVDFVLDIHLDKMSLYEQGSLNALYKGQAEVTVDTYDVDDISAEPKYNYVYPFTYPHTGFLDAGSITVTHFKQDFLEHLAAELSMKHVQHKDASGIADDR
jgi:hypothetical protein